MAIAEKLTKIAEDMQKVYDAGKAAAVMLGETSFNEANKTLIISGLPAAPKRFNLYALSAVSPEDDDYYFIRGLDYDAEGFYFDGGNQKVMACLWLATSTNASTNSAANGSIAERINNNYKIFTYDNGTFTVKLQSNNKYYFGENYTYRWTAVF